ncbi:cell growth regulator with EF hand domain protein 1 isoform X1 [Sinocyclocheilus rhinocerous]|uniref:cell growth regulator with EF hand domain protein 1 isoform X1 n=1 Tax=Sinocyclocheilus rhinocerous TaxID=307959 RepID=UPI0007BA7AE7|nr:PREDICTED: cell growth regulator with EF hand domain protein 1-like isoform X1 [Sinocyclocheilus rhinocerous]
MQTYGAVLLSSAGVGLIMERPLTAAARGTGVPKRSSGAVNMITTRILFLLILPSLSLCAPQIQRTRSDDIVVPDLANPFGSSEDNRRLLQSYIKSSLKEGQTSPELNTREQEIFFLFSLYDYDRSGQMDGLELMQLLTDFLTYHEMMPKSADYVVSLVDYLLQTHDLNQDGLLVPSELLSSTINHRQENNIAPPDPPAEEALNQGQTHTDSKDGVSESHQQDAEVNQVSEHENETSDSAKEDNVEVENHKQIPEKLEEQQDRLQPPEEQELQDDHQEQKNIPVHQGQPEI